VAFTAGAASLTAYTLWYRLIARHPVNRVVPFTLLGPVVGVAAMVGAVGLTESAKGDLKAKLAELGTTLITAEAGGTFGQQNPSFPKDAVARATRVPTVERAAAVSNLNGVLTIPTQGSEDYYRAFPVPVLAADTALPQVLQVPVESGRWLARSDQQNHTRAAVIGSALAHEYGYVPGEIRTIRLNGIDYGVVGVLSPVALEPSLDNAVFVTQWAAKHDFASSGAPSKMYVRAVPGTTQETADALPTAINLGGTDSVSTKIPSDALQAASNDIAARIRAAQAQHSGGGASSTPSSAGLIWPVSGPITSPFGWRWGRMHEGIDIGVPMGTPIRAAAAGTIIYCGWEEGYGNLTVIDHGGNLATAYGHQSSIAVACGQQVAQGQVIGYVGCTGHCTGPHLHFEVRIDGNPVDPMGYL